VLCVEKISYGSVDEAVTTAQGRMRSDPALRLFTYVCECGSVHLTKGVSKSRQRFKLVRVPRLREPQTQVHYTLADLLARFARTGRA
jgi:hypothetical protein